MAHKHHLTAHIRIRRHFTGQHNYTIWGSDHTHTRGLKTITDEWKTLTKQLKLKAGRDHWDLMDITGTGPNQLKTMPRHKLTCDFLNQEIKLVMSLIHGKQRKIIRKAISAAVRKREESLEDGKLGNIITSMLDREQNFFQSDILQLDDGTLTTDQLLIHNTITDALQNIFTTPTHHKNTPTQHPGFDSERFLTDETFFTETILANPSTRNIPPRIQNTLWKALQPTPESDRVKAELANTFLTTPSYEDFLTTIHHSPNGTALGMSDVSYNMLKAWPEEATKAAYTALSTFWTNRDIPEHFKWRYQCLKPKTQDANPTADDFRPLTLLDSLRKIWERLILNIIQKACINHGSYQPNQHCRPADGTDTALLSLRA